MTAAYPCVFLLKVVRLQNSLLLMEHSFLVGKQQSIHNCSVETYVRFLVSNTVFMFPTLEQCKLGIVKFIEAEQVPELEAVIHLIVASSDTRHSVATAADLELKSKQRYKFECLEKMVVVFVQSSLL